MTDRALDSDRTCKDRLRHLDPSTCTQFMGRLVEAHHTTHAWATLAVNLIEVFVGHPLRFIAIVGFNVVGSAGAERVDPPVVQDRSPFEHPLQAGAAA